MKIDDDENDVHSNSCNKSDYNVTIIYVPPEKKLNCKNETSPKPLPTDEKSNSKEHHCIGKTCSQCILKKLLVKEMIETKKLKSKLVRIYLERKKRKIMEKSNALSGDKLKKKPPLFNASDLEK